MIRKFVCTDSLNDICEDDRIFDVQIYKNVIYPSPFIRTVGRDISDRDSGFEFTVAKRVSIVKISACECAINPMISISIAVPGSVGVAIKCIVRIQVSSNDSRHVCVLCCIVQNNFDLVSPVNIVNVSFTTDFKGAQVDGKQTNTVTDTGDIAMV